MAADPLQPLSPAQLAAQEAATAKEGVVHRDLVAVDQAANVLLLKGHPDETISAHAARADLEGKRWGRWLSRFLDLFQRDHGEGAIAGDLERAQAVDAIEANAASEKPPAGKTSRAGG
jgi:hypothetical protein